MVISSMKWLFPDFEFKDVTRIPLSTFKGKKLVIFDIDNTLFYAETTKTRKDVVDWFKKANKKYRCICISNSFTIDQRRKKIESILKTEVFHNQERKPSKILFQKVKKKYKVNAKDMVIIGDMRMTDIAFGKRNSFMTVLVDPLSRKELKRIRLARFIEEFLVFITHFFIKRKKK
jgi:HAD superfamily phosphatase (TIGR01668 family)